MGTGFVLYDNFETYKNRYSLDFNDVNHNQKIRDFYTWIDKELNQHLLIETEFLKEDLRPDFTRTVVLLHGDNTRTQIQSLEPKPRAVEWNEVVFSMMKHPQKKEWNSMISFGKQGLIIKKPIMSFPCGWKGASMPPNKVIIENTYWLYDHIRDIVNLVIS